MTGRSPRLKWHMLRRKRDDPPFLRANLEAGLVAGAALEVDIVSTADGHFFCLHDLTLDRETTGSGLASDVTRSEIGRLRQRATDGAALTEAPLFLDEIVAALHRHPHAPRQVQLDFKEPASSFSNAMLDRLCRTVGDFAAAFVVGTTDPEAFARVKFSSAGIAVGFDPLDLHASRMPTSADEFEGLAATTLRLGAGACVYYLNAGLVLAGQDAGVDLVERMHRTGAEVDAWTIDVAGPAIRDDLRRLLAAGVDQITTNEPDALGSIIGELL